MKYNLDLRIFKPHKSIDHVTCHMVFLENILMPESKHLDTKELIFHFKITGLDHHVVTF